MTEDQIKALRLALKMGIINNESLGVAISCGQITPYEYLKITENDN